MISHCTFVPIRFIITPNNNYILQVCLKGVATLIVLILVYFIEFYCTSYLVTPEKLDRLRVNTYLIFHILFNSLEHQRLFFKFHKKKFNFFFTRFYL